MLSGTQKSKIGVIDKVATRSEACLSKVNKAARKRLLSTKVREESPKSNSDRRGCSVFPGSNFPRVVNEGRRGCCGGWRSSVQTRETTSFPYLLLAQSANGCRRPASRRVALTILPLCSERSPMARHEADHRRTTQREREAERGNIDLLIQMLIDAIN